MGELARARGSRRDRRRLVALIAAREHQPSVVLLEGCWAPIPLGAVARRGRARELTVVTRCSVQHVMCTASPSGARKAR